jgi:hypothetical protein
MDDLLILFVCGPVLLVLFICSLLAVFVIGCFALCFAIFYYAIYAILLAARGCAIVVERRRGTGDQRGL